MRCQYSRVPMPSLSHVHAVKSEYKLAGSLEPLCEMTGVLKLTDETVTWAADVHSNRITPIRAYTCVRVLTAELIVTPW